MCKGRGSKSCVSVYVFSGREGKGWEGRKVRTVFIVASCCAGIVDIFFLKKRVGGGKRKIHFSIILEHTRLAPASLST